MRGGNIIGHVQSNKEGKTKHLEGSDFNPVDNMFKRGIKQVCSYSIQWKTISEFCRQYRRTGCPRAMYASHWKT